MTPHVTATISAAVAATFDRNRDGTVDADDDVAVFLATAPPRRYVGGTGRSSHTDHAEQQDGDEALALFRSALAVHDRGPFFPQAAGSMLSYLRR